MSTASCLPALTLSSWPGLPPGPPHFPSPESGCQSGDGERLSKLGRSQEKPLDQPGLGGRGQMNGKRTQNPDDRTAHIDLLVPEAKVRSKVTDHALRWGAWGQAGGRGQRRGEDSTDGGSQPSHHREAGGAGDQDRAVPGCRCSGQPAAKLVLLQVCSPERVVGRIFPLPTLQLAWQGFGQNASFKGHKKTQKDNQDITKQLSPHVSPRGDLNVGGQVHREGVARDVSTRYSQPSLQRCFRNAGADNLQSGQLSSAPSPTSGSQSGGFRMAAKGIRVWSTPSVPWWLPPQAVTMPASKTPWPLDPLLGHIQLTPQLLNPPQCFWKPRWARLPPKAAGICTWTHRAGCMQQ